MKELAKTAFVTIAKLSERTKTPYAKDIFKKLIKKIKFKIPRVERGYFIESRYKSSEEMIKNSKIKQVIEFGSGFTPHALSLIENDLNYIEVDFPEIVTLKKGIVREINPNLNTRYISGNVFEEKTWKNIKDKLKKEPTIIFCEGVMMYTSKKQRDFLFKQIKEILNKNKGFFFFEDSLRFHPEFKEDEKFKLFQRRISSLSKNKEYEQKISQTQLIRELESYGFEVKRKSTNMDLSTIDFDQEGKDIIKKFKMFILTPKNEKN